MSTRRSPQLSHQSVMFAELFKRFHEELTDNEKTILDRLGFYIEYGSPETKGYTGSLEATEVLRELAGVLTRAAVIHVDSGFKAARKVIATLEAIAGQPNLFFLETTEPEARGVVAAAYQRADEPAGIYWTDLEICDVNDIIHERIKTAAEAGIRKLLVRVKSGRSVEGRIHFLADRLREIFLRFNERITRKSVQSSRGHCEYFQKEEGCFFLFVEAVLAPLNKFFVGLPVTNGVSSRELSAEYIVKRSLAAPKIGIAQLCP